MRRQKPKIQNPLLQIPVVCGFYLSVYGVLNKLSEYVYLYLSKNITSYAFFLVFKIVKASIVSTIIFFFHLKYQKTHGFLMILSGLIRLNSINLRKKI